jgi:hypothetical protein
VSLATKPLLQASHIFKKKIQNKFCTHMPKCLGGLGRAFIIKIPLGRSLNIEKRQSKIPDLTTDIE